MIKIKRIEEPKALTRNKKRWTQRISESKKKKDRIRAQSKYKHPDIKAALEKMFNGKCSYCESAISHIDYGHIEHFRPKGNPRYYKLAIVWSNLHLACGRCNGAEHKGEKFPSRKEGGPLLDPTKDDPEKHLIFDYDKRTGLANIIHQTIRGNTSWATYGLNRPKLVAYRSKYVQKLRAIAKNYFTDPEAREIIDHAVLPGSEYSAFAKVLKKNLEAKQKNQV